MRARYGQRCLPGMHRNYRGLRRLKVNNFDMKNELKVATRPVSGQMACHFGDSRWTADVGGCGQRAVLAHPGNA
jgi:hypothetical protein